MKPTRRQVDIVDVPLVGGRVLHVEVQRHPEGDPAALSLSVGAGEPGEWHHAHERITLPGEALEALGVLAREGVSVREGFCTRCTHPPSGNAKQA